MKVIKTASGKKLKMSKKEWQAMGKKAGWMKVANTSEPQNIANAIDRLISDLTNLKGTVVQNNVDLRTLPNVGGVPNGLSEIIANIMNTSQPAQGEPSPISSQPVPQDVNIVK